MMTEAEARKKWCPHIRISGTDRQSAMTNRCDTPTMTCCIASECMAWRWGPSTRWEHDADGNPTKAILEDSRGYCGLGGKP